jgi:hypothetical protein
MVMVWELLEVLMTVMVPVNVAVLAMSESSLLREDTRAGSRLFVTEANPHQREPSTILTTLTCFIPATQG